MQRFRVVLPSIILAVIANIGPSARAEECEVPPSVSVNVSPRPTGIPVVTVSYSFPDTTSSAQRRVGLRIRNSSGGIGNIGGFQPGDSSGTWTVNHDMSCQPSGTYTFEATAITCNDLERQATSGYGHNVRPTVSVSYGGPDDQGHGDVTVNYNFPNTSDASQRFLLHRVYQGEGFGTGESLRPTDRTETWVFPYAMTCRTGTFEHEITAYTCSGETETARDSVTVHTKPTVSVSVGGLDENGNVDLTINYGFPNTDQASQRSIVVRMEEAGGGFGTLGGLHPDQQYGVWNLTRNLTCDLRDLNVWVIATSCTGENAEARQPMPKPERPSVSVALAKVKGSPGWLDATIDYDMGKASGNWSLRLDLRPWTDANGQTHPGRQLLLEPPANRAGTRVVRFLAPSGAQQMAVRATAATCVDTKTADASIPCDPCEGASADPVFFSSGNVRVTDADALPPIAAHRLVRTYNSDEQVVALFGRGFTTLFDRRMIVDTANGEQIVSLVTDTNQVVTFRGAGGAFRQTWPTGRQAMDILSHDAATGMYAHRGAGSTEVAIFSADGRLAVLRDLATGREAQVAYDAQGLPQSLTDSWSGTSWILTIDATNRRVSSIAVSGRPDLVWSYSYDSAGNMLNVTAPGSARWRTYEYSANRMTASYDALGDLIESHTYDADGYGISSTGPSDEIASIAYDLPGSVAGERVTRLTYKTGATAEYALRRVGGAYRPVRVTGGCSSCGAGDATYVHDRDGRVIREQGADGYVTLRTYGATSLASEERSLRPAGCDPSTDAQQCRLGPDALAVAMLEASTATVRTVYTHGDPLWPDRVTAAEGPSVYATGRSRRENFSYHASSGALAGTSLRGWTGEEPTADFERATSRTFYGDATACNPRGDDGCEGEPDSGLTPAFNPGGTFNSAWLTLPQPARLVKTVDGPRVGVQDVTSLVYYPVDASVPALLRGQLAATKNAAGHITRYESYDIFGNATRTVDDNGVVFEATVDALGRLVSSTTKGLAGCDTTRDPLCATDLVAERTYTGAGPLEKEKSPGGGVTTYTYDSRGRVRTISRGSSAADLREQIESSYDPLTGKKSLERLLSMENGAWLEKKREAFAYDAQGRLQTVTHAYGAFVQYAYDAADRVNGVRDENHTAVNTRYTHDPAGRLATVVQTLTGAPGGAITTRYAYDAHGNLVSVTDPNGNATTYVYDDFGQMLQQSSPVSGVTTYTYDEAGNLLSTTDANGVTTTRTYDVLGRVSTALAATREEGEAEEVRWTYDNSAFGIGSLASMTDPTGSTSYAYERRGLLASEAKMIGGTAYSTGYGYDANGNRTRITYPSGRAVTYTFDYANRPASASTGSTMLVTSTRYLPFGPMTEMAFGNGTVKQMSFDALYRPLTNQLSGGEGDLIASYNYVHDPAGNITALHDALDPSFNRDFEYDDLHRLITANGGEALWGAGSYSYDAMGNMRAATLGSRTDLAFRYQGATSKLSSVTENEDRRSVTYDAAGNELAAGTATYAYTFRNHLARQNSTSYLYDGRGIRTITLRPASILAFQVPSTVNGGSSAQGELVLSSPAPAGGALVTLTSSSAVASVPAGVTVAAGQTTAVFTITTQAVAGQQQAILTATYNGSARTATISVVGSRFDEVVVQPQMIVGGESARGTVSLAVADADRDTAVSLESSSTDIRVPEVVMVRAGERSVDFPVVTAPVAARSVARITASVGGEARETTVTILPPSVVAITFTPTAVYGTESTTGSITLDGRAPDGGLSVALTTMRELLSVPPTVTIAAGERTATFSATATPVEVEIAVPVMASAGEASVTMDVMILPPHLTDLTVTPGNVIGGEPLSATVTLNAPAAPEGARLQLSTSDPAIVAAPPQTAVPSGATSETASLTTGPVSVPTPVVVSASRAGITRSATVTIEPPPGTLASFSVAPQSVIGTNDVTGTVTLTDAAPAVGVEIELASSDRAAATVPPVVTVPAGATQATFRISTSLVAVPANVVITAALTTTQKSAALSVLPSAGNYVAALSVTPTFIVGGTTATATVTLSMPSSESGGSLVILASSAPVISVPSKVKINPNSVSATFTVTAAPVTEPVAVTLTATYGGVVQRIRLIVAPENTVTIGSLAVTPARVIGGTASTGVVTLTGAAPFGGAVVSLEAKRRNIVTMPATVTIPEGATSATFAIATQVVHGNKDRSVEIVAAYNNVATTATLTVAPSSSAAAPAQAVALCASAALEPCLTQTAVRIATTTATVHDRQYNLYTPELSLLAETAATVGTAPPLAYEYIWFAGQPLAQVDIAANETHYYFNDHLGTPILQTDATARVVWRVEYDPYGKAHGLRRGESRHQPLRFPGQEGDVAGELSYNVFRWYRAGWGRYTQGDPDRDNAPFHAYDYANGNPQRWSDPRGLKAFNMFEAPPNLPSMPGAVPDKKCCSQQAIQKATDSVDYQIDRLMQGKMPAGTVIAMTISPILCGNGLCSNYPVDPKEYVFNKGYSKDPCVNYCINFHEFLHFTDMRQWDVSWSHTQITQFNEFFPYVGEKACLKQFGGK